MRTVIPAIVAAAGLILAATPGLAAPCDAEIRKVEVQLQRTSDAGKRHIIESLLDEARRALVMREADRCMKDVGKAKQALRMR
ncbi:MAG: hypothetical protein ACHQF3_13005 [Alphaproteobacteria bacterium]